MAQKRFGNAKAISSAQFQSDEDQKAADYEKQVMSSAWVCDDYFPFLHAYQYHSDGSSCSKTKDCGQLSSEVVIVGL